MQLNYNHSMFIILFALSQTTAASIKVEEQQVNIDEESYFCGTHLADMLSHYCNTYYSKRAKREITRQCCHGLGCTIRYVMVEYCQEIKPQYAHLFKTLPKGVTASDDSAEFQKKSNTKQSDNLETPVIDNQSKILNAVRKAGLSIQEASQSGQNKMERDLKPAPQLKPKNKQVRTRKTRKPLILHFFDKARGARGETHKNHNLKRSFRHDNRNGRQCQCKCRRARPHQILDALPSSGSFIGTDHVPHGNPVQSKFDNFQF